MSQFYNTKPSDFITALEVSTVFMECDQKLLLLHRADCELSPHTWCVPGGKLEKGETPSEGLLREIAEELHLHPKVHELEYRRSVYVRHPQIDYQLHLFYWRLRTPPSIVLNPKEHQDYVWQPIERIRELDLLEGQWEAFKYVCDLTQSV